MTRHGVSAWSAVATFFFIAASLPLLASSHVRIVRLSSVEGPVQMDRATGEGLERAILNTPVVEGTRLVTGTDGLAEVEFENQSALRLTGDSEVKFSQLLMNDAGAKVNQIQVAKGLVYLDTAKGDDIYRLVIGNNSFLVHRDSQLRLERHARSSQARRLQRRCPAGEPAAARHHSEEGIAHARREPCRHSHSGQERRSRALRCLE